MLSLKGSAMQDWIEANAVTVLAAAAVVLLLLALVTLVAWRITRRRLNRERADRVLLERDRIDL